MNNNFSLRPMTPQDVPALDRLAADSPDTGLLTFSGHFEVGAYRDYLAIEKSNVGVVAEAAGNDGLVGTGQIRLGECQFEGTLRPYGYLNSLMVHPDYRRNGIANQIAQWRVEYIHQGLGEAAVILAYIQKSNNGSQRTAQKWYKQFIEKRVIGISAKMRSKPPSPQPGLAVRPAAPRELDEVADKANAFYREYNLYEPQTGEQLSEWLDLTPFEAPYRYCRVAVDSAGNILAGMVITEACRLFAVRIERMPAFIKLANSLVHLFPPDGVLRLLAAERFWHQPGRVDAAHFLYEMVRWEMRDRGNILQSSVDTRDPLLKVYNLAPWDPKLEFSLAIRGPVPLDERRLLYTYIL